MTGKIKPSAIDSISLVEFVSRPTWRPAIKSVSLLLD